jgi:RepB DNA-primase from phage plasmid
VLGEKRGFRPTQSPAQIKNSLPKLFPGATERQNNIIVRPLSDKVHFVQLDDLDAEGLKRVGEAAFLTLTTSPGNHQAWVAVSDIKEGEEAKDFSRQLRKGAGADKSASGATRVAGTVNYKRKYEPDFPTVKIDEAHPGRVVTKAQLEAMGIVAAPDPETVASEELVKARQTGPSQYRHRANKTWPNYALSLAGAPP